MDVIYTDTTGEDVGVLTHYAVDLDLAEGMDFEIKTSPDNMVMSYGCNWYIEGTEYGGRVDRIRVDTANAELTWGGRSWRGILATKVVSPPEGKAYLHLSGNWQDVVQALIEDHGLEDLFAADAADLVLDDWQVERYATLLDVLNKILSGKRHRLSLAWVGGKVRVGAAPIQDLTSSVQYETNDRVSLLVEDDRGGVNHLICLGQGELEKREVVHLYCTPTGGITELEQTFTGLDEIVETYVNTGAETRAELKAEGFKHLVEKKNKKTFSVNVTDYDVQISDIVGGKESITGMKVAEPVKNIIFKLVDGGSPEIEYKVGETA